MMAPLDTVIHSLCVAELAPWIGRQVTFAAALAEFAHYNRSRRSIFMLRIHDGDVSILDKSAFFTREQISDESDTANPFVKGANLYREFLQQVVRTICPEIDTVLCVDLDDHGYSSETAPIFVIQKLSGASSILLPHFEFILYDFHQSVVDDLPFAEKTQSAVFVGSTTGHPDVITVETVRNLGFPRLRSAMFFKGNPDVDFRLPRIVQSTPEAEQLLREMGFGTGEVSWPEQFQHKFVISMDGNAGACSRVTNVLKSNCVLLKYDSRHTLHYSRHFVPWLHYIPIGHDKDVDVILGIEKNRSGFFEFISVEGNKFYRAFLDKERIFDYTGALLRMYNHSFEQSGVAVALGGGPTRGTPARPGAVLMVSRADVIEGYRTVLGRDPESEQAIADHMAAPSVAELYAGLLESEEFQEKLRAEPKPLDWPPIEVESGVADAGQLAAMFGRVRTTWSRLGEQDPYQSVIPVADREEFYASGENDVRNLTSFAARAGIELTGRTCLDLGCGVGRVARWLAPLFRRVQGVDVSPRHLAIAREQLAEAGIDNVVLSRVDESSDLRRIRDYDVLFSILTLQHNPPPLIAYCLMQMLSNLSPGGVAFVQVPTYGLDYSFRVDEYLDSPVGEQPVLEMHVLPQSDILKIVYATGCRLLEVREDSYIGNAQGISNTFFVAKAPQ